MRKRLSHLATTTDTQSFNWDPAIFADDYLKNDNLIGYFYRERLELVMKALRFVGSGAVLDVGCGPGAYVRSCAERGFKYTGVDLTHRMVDEGRRRYGRLDGVDFVIGDARCLPFRDNSFDAVLCLGVLEYIPQENEHSYLAELIRVSKRGGIIILSFLNARSLYWRLSENVIPAIKFATGNIKALFQNSRYVRMRDCPAETPLARKFVLEQRKGIMRGKGLSVLAENYFAPNILPLRLGNRYVVQALCLSSKLDPTVHTWLFGRLGMGFIIVARTPSDEHG